MLFRFLVEVWLFSEINALLCRFDVELQKVADSLQAEKSTNEKVIRERNDAVNQKFTLEKEMKVD